MKPEQMTETTTDDRDAFECSCGAKHARAAYCIAQQAQGYAVRFTCPECGTSMTVPDLP